jgi:hypothetical protein
MMYRIIKYSLLVAAIYGLHSAEAQNRQFRGGFGFGFYSLESSAVRLASMEPMKAEVKLDEEQVKKLADLEAEYRESTQGLFSRDAFQGLSEEERDKKLAEIREKRESLTEANTKKAKEVLKPEQMKRLLEIAFQQQIQNGISGVFRVDEFIKEAKVTEDQQKKAEDLSDALRKEAAEKSDDRREQFAWIREEGAKKYEPKFEAILTAEQKTVLARMKGKEYDVASLRPQFGNRSQRGGRPGGDAGRPGGRPERPQRPGENNN